MTAMQHDTADTTDTADAPPSAEEMRQRTRAGNRMVAALLIGLSMLLLAAAFGVAVLVVYGPY